MSREVGGRESQSGSALSGSGLSGSGLSDGLARSLQAKVVAAQREWRAPAVSVGVVRDGELVWSGHVGSARLGEQAAPPHDDTQFMIGSVTKTFTALTVMALRDEGRLSLDDTIGDHLPDVKHGSLPLRQMLAHASGLQREPVGHIWETLQAPDRDAFRAGLEQAEQVLPAHHAFHYSNLAYALLGQVVEAVTERPWADVVHERVIEPLGMTHTSLTPGDTKAFGYQIDPYAGTATQEPYFPLKATAPVGGLWSTVADMARYAAYVARPDDRVVAPATLDEMCRPIIMTDVDSWGGAYGLGFGMGRRGERVYVGHGGAMPGFLTGLRVRRPDGVGAIVFANCSSGALTLALATDLIEAVVDAEPTLAAPWVPETAHPDLEPLVGLWWSEGSPFTLFVREGQLWSRLSDTDPLTETRYAAEGADRFRAVEGRERGEVLEVVRTPGGGIDKLYFATYAVTREPLAFADLQD